MKGPFAADRPFALCPPELAATLAEGGSDVLALEADLEQWESTEQAFAAGVCPFWPTGRGD